MIREIYTRMPSDKNYILGIETHSEIESILGQIRMILGTKPMQVLGNVYFGVDLNKYLFNYGLDIEQIRTSIMSHFMQYLEYDKSKYTISLDIHYGKTTEDESDYALIDISINQQKCLGVIVAQ